MGRWQRLVASWQTLPTPWRRAAVAGSAVLALALSAAGFVPSRVRAAVEQRGARRGLVVTVERVRPSFRGLTLSGVHATDPKLPGARVDLDRVELRFSLGGLTAVRALGGRVVVVGSSHALKERFQALRASPPAARDDREAMPSRTRLTLSGIDLSWAPTERESPDVWAWGMRGELSRAGDSRVGADLVRFRRGVGSADVRGLQAELGLTPSFKLTRLEASSLLARLQFNQAGTEPSAEKSAREGTSLLALWRTIRPVVSEHTVAQFRSSVGAMTLDLARSDESLRIGPNRWELTRDGDALSLSGAPISLADAGTPLTLKARAPLSEGLAEIELRGGPVSLASLGIREGDFGLVGVRSARLEAEAHVVLDATGAPGADGRVDVKTRGRLENLTVDRRALAPEPLGGIQLAWLLEGSAALDGESFQIRAGEFSVGALRAQLEGKLERSPEGTRLSLRAAVPLASCDSVLEAAPRRAAPLLMGVRMAGIFSLAARLAYDSSSPDATAVSLDVKNECRITEVPTGINPQRFRAAFAREVKGADGLPLQIESGPGTADWTPYEDISSHMETAIIVCEDAGFFNHRGFAYRAIENSIRSNLIARRFLRGGSTVSMQLAKNLYLGHEKTLSRKLQEAVLTQLLEQELSKHEIMELYLNVIEFGPGIYGIKQAARYYFNQEPADLSLGQALYLASILPNPDAHHFLPDGRVSTGWSRYLQKLMRIAYDIQRISEDELAQALNEQVAFRQANSAARDLAQERELNHDFSAESPPELPVSP